MQRLPSQLVLSVAFRIALSLVTRTYFQPDEYYQSLEPAHRFVFGYGALTWEWTTRPPVRSFVYPAIFVPIYWTIKIMGLEKSQMIIFAPKVLQGVLASLTDYYTYHLVRRHLGPRHASVALVLSLGSFFHALSLTRTLSNSLETSLTAAALYHWPLQIDTSKTPNIRFQFRRALLLAAFACMVRPTSCVIWLYMLAVTVMDGPNTDLPLSSLFTDVMSIGFGAVALLTAVDSLYYDRLTSTPLTFLYHNFLSPNPLSRFYGVAPWHFYISQALPLLLTTSLPFALHGMHLAATGKAGRAASKLLGLILWTTAVYSITGHKEWRFLHPLLPPLLLFASKSVVDMHNRVLNREDKQKVSAQSGTTRLPIRRPHIFLLLLAIPPSVYVLLFHSRAQIAVMSYLGSLPGSDLSTVGFLMPCHSTPWQASLHREELEGGRLWALGCEPPLGLQGTDLLHYRDQTDVFYTAPPAYLTTRFPRRVDAAFPPSPKASSPAGEPTVQDWEHEWPSHLVFFGALLEGADGHAVRTLLEDKGYKEVWTARNGFEEDHRRKGGVKVWRWRSGSEDRKSEHESGLWT